MRERHNYYYYLYVAGYYTYSCYRHQRSESKLGTFWCRSDFLHTEHHRHGAARWQAETSSSNPHALRRYRSLVLLHFWLLKVATCLILSSTFRCIFHCLLSWGRGKKKLDGECFFFLYARSRRRGGLCLPSLCIVRYSVCECGDLPSLWGPCLDLCHILWWTVG